MSDKFFEVTIFRFKWQDDPDSFEKGKKAPAPLNHIHFMFTEDLWDDNPHIVLEKVREHIKTLGKKSD